MVAMLSILAEAQTRPKTEWLREFKENLQEEICSTGTHFRACRFKTASDCNGFLEGHLPVCQRLADIPERVDLVKDGNRLALKIGSCLGRKIEQSTQVERTAECQRRPR